MGYRTIYDGAREIPGVALPILGALAAGFCSLLWAFRADLFSMTDREAAARGKRMLLYFLLASVLWTVGTAFGAYQTWRDGPHLLAEGRAEVVEGVVEDFVPMKSHDTERFTVRGVRFSYSSAIQGQGFNQPSGRTGPLRDGVRVRIHYTPRPCGGGCADIWRLEIAE